MIALTNCDVYTGSETLSSHPVLVEGRDVVDVFAAQAVPGEADVVDLAGMKLAPGFVDLQVNGGGGVLFTEAPAAGSIEAIEAAHRLGTTYFWRRR